MDLWGSSADHLYEAMRELGGDEHVTPAQKLEIAKIEALLAIGQELSRIQDQGINPDWSQR